MEQAFSNQLRGHAAKGAGAVLGGAELRKPSEIEREMERLAVAAHAVAGLQSELGARLSRYRVAEPESNEKLLPVDDATQTDAAREIREITKSLEASAEGLRSQLRTLAI